jgi:light-regulated signal transduction histidine kinase (bacteriophytochrome)
MGFVELLQKEAGPTLSKGSKARLTTIFHAAQRMGELVDDLLAFSHLSRADLKRTDVDVRELVRATMADFDEETKTRHIEWNIHPMPRVQADRPLLQMALVNLVSNAVKFTGTRKKPKIEIGCIPGGSHETTVFIRDNGVGFDPQYSTKIFEVFQRLHSQSDFEGTGIGLANVQRIIQRHGGRAWAVGKVDEGATFYFSIPKKQPKRNEA